MTAKFTKCLVGFLISFIELCFLFVCFVILQKPYNVEFEEAECYKIDPVNKKVYCRSNQSSTLDGIEEFTVDYDVLILAMGARVNTFNTPGVEEHAHFLKVFSEL